MIGIERDDNSLGPLYGEKYIDFFSKTSIGIRFETEPRKITYFTNHRSFEKATMKPFKMELVEKPQYRIFVMLENKNPEFDKIRTSIFESQFIYSPYLGHAYCQAIVSDPVIHESEAVTPKGHITSCVILDEGETYNNDFMLKILPQTKNSSVIIERHLHHYFMNSHLERRVLKHWIPVNSSPYRIERDGVRKLSRFYRIDDEVVCIY
jgi:hypothetical protein